VASATVLWAVKARKIVPTPDTIFTGSTQSADADAMIRRIVAKGGNPKDKESETITKVTVTI
jgi:hypothetical protein